MFLKKNVFLFLAFFVFFAVSHSCAEKSFAAPASSNSEQEESSQIQESGGVSSSIFARAWNGGVVVFLVLVTLVAMSVLTWGVVATKILFLNKIKKTNTDFIKSFWDSRSLNELNGKLNSFPYSPAKEVFKIGYAELLKSNQLKDTSFNQNLAFTAATENLNRALSKARLQERSKLEKYLGMLAISASAAPFIGLFGTVWGIMGAFEGIARSGSASLAAVAPGISEALIATAFGLAAAIPAVIGYNLSAARIRAALCQVDGFCADFMNIVGRYLVTDKNSRTNSGASASPVAES